jgi:hypothetical protein
MTDIIEVQMIKNVAGKPRPMGRCYNLKVSPPRKLSGHQRITRPHFVQDSGHVLTWSSTCSHGGLYKHNLRDSYTINEMRHGSVEINEKNPGTRVADIKSCLQTWAFKYVETKESLYVYRLGGH